MLPAFGLAGGRLDHRTNTDQNSIESAKVTSIVTVAAQAGICCTRRIARLPSAICQIQLTPKYTPNTYRFQITPTG